MQEIYFKKEAREKLFNGANKLHDAVAATLGPNGKTVIVTNERGEQVVTKDGVTVAKAIQFKDPVENIGANLIKEVAELTLSKAGDGTTTSIVLATAFINNLKEFNSTEINKAFDEIIPKVIKKLEENSRKLEKSNVKYVASISANNDLQIGNIIQQAYNHASIVKVEESNLSEDKLKLVTGMSLPVSYFSKHFITNLKKGEVVYDEPYILLIDGTLNNLKPFEHVIKRIAENDESLIIIAENVNETTLRLLETNVISKVLKTCVIKTPGFAQHRKDLLNDLQHFTGAKVIKDFNSPVSFQSLGKLKSIKVNKTNSLLVKHDEVDISDYLNDLKQYLESEDLENYDKSLVQQRIENLESNISIIKVGGGSEIEMKERFDRYDDAVRAVACALEEGIVEGGGMALNWCFKSLSNDISNIEIKILESLLAPYQMITDNNSLINIKDMFEQNIIDPLKVTRTALENAVSVAKTILSTDVVVLNEYQWN